MPKKTKKEKILAEYRRRLARLENQPKKKKGNSKRPPPSKAKTKKDAEQTFKEADYDKMIARFTLADLKKTLLVTLFLLTLEFFIFYANLKGVSFIGF